jgi:2-keto-4-pentenoate hydratase
MRDDRRDGNCSVPPTGKCIPVPRGVPPTGTVREVRHDMRRHSVPVTTTQHIDATRQASERLHLAQQTLTPCAPVRDLIGANGAAAYAVQHSGITRRVEAGATVVGRKVGLTSPAVQAQLGVDQPDFGVLLDDMAHPDGDTIPLGGLLQPKVEAEVAFVLGADLADGDLDEAQVRAAVAQVLPALEIVDSRIVGWDITFADTVADNGSSARYVLGAEAKSLDEVEPVDVEMSMSRNGQVVSTGSGAACLGDPLNALAWLARTARNHGEPLRAGQVVLSGALGPMVAVAPGDTFVAQISGLGAVTVSFTERDHA